MNSIEISASGIEKLLKQIDETKAMGTDGISQHILKRCAEPISLDLDTIFEQSLLTGVLLLDWKIAYVVLIHKGGSKKDVENYRPISLTPIVCKVMEHILYFGIMKHLIENNISRKGISCTTQLVEFYHDLACDIDSGGQSDCNFLDFRKAFDTVTHSFLCNKLKLPNINPVGLKWSGMEWINFI